MPAASQDLETSNLLTCNLNKHSVSQPWTSSYCKNTGNFSAGNMPRETCSNFHYLSVRQECHFSVSYIFLQLFCKNCLCPLTHSSLLSLDTAYHLVGGHLLQRHLLKLVWIQAWSSENSAEHYINLQNIRFCFWSHPQTLSLPWLAPQVFLLFLFQRLTELTWGVWGTRKSWGKGFGTWERTSPNAFARVKHLYCSPGGSVQPYKGKQITVNPLGLKSEG